MNDQSGSGATAERPWAPGLWEDSPAIVDHDPGIGAGVVVGAAAALLILLLTSGSLAAAGMALIAAGVGLVTEWGNS